MGRGPTPEIPLRKPLACLTFQLARCGAAASSHSHWDPVIPFFCRGQSGAFVEGEAFVEVSRGVAGGRVGVIRCGLAYQ